MRFFILLFFASNLLYILLSERTIGWTFTHFCPKLYTFPSLAKTLAWQCLKVTIRRGAWSPKVRKARWVIRLSLATHLPKPPYRALEGHTHTSQYWPQELIGLYYWAHLSLFAELRLMSMTVLDCRDPFSFHLISFSHSFSGYWTRF